MQRFEVSGAVRLLYESLGVEVLACVSMELDFCNRKTCPPHLSHRLSLVSVLALSN